MASISTLTPQVAISQPLLDIENKQRSNPFAWRGQFSPQLVEVLLSAYASEGDVIFDPFAGVGTTLLEASKLGMRGRGTELNPSAYLMAQSVEWVRLPISAREKAFKKAGTIVQGIESSLPDCESAETYASQVAEILSKKLKVRTFDDFTTHLLINAMIRSAESSISHSKALRQHCAILRCLPYTDLSQRVFQADARKTPLAPQSVDVILTSPPYINVFNYHENNRRVMELLGWDILTIAKAELGSNRKNRGNRFLTVIQYCLDMRLVLIEMRRVLKSGGRALIVIGRESKVRGVSFENGELVEAIAKDAGFNSLPKQQRSFRNRFGNLIVEEILHFTPTLDFSAQDGREAALSMLKAKAEKMHNPEVLKDLRSAISHADLVLPSPIYGQGS